MLKLVKWWVQCRTEQLQPAAGVWETRVLWSPQGIWRDPAQRELKGVTAALLQRMEQSSFLPLNLQLYSLPCTKGISSPAAITHAVITHVVITHGQPVWVVSAHHLSWATFPKTVVRWLVCWPLSWEFHQMNSCRINSNGEPGLCETSVCVRESEMKSCERLQT